MVELAQVVDDDARCRRLVSVGPKPNPRFYDGSEMDESEERALHQAAIDLYQSLGAGYTEAYVNVIRDRLGCRVTLYVGGWLGADEVS